MATAPIQEDQTADPEGARLDTAARLAKASDAMDKGETREALKHYLIVLRKEGANHQALIGTANAFLVERQFKKAIIFFSKVLTRAPENTLAAEGRGLSHLRLKSYRSAERDFKTAVKNDAGRWRSWNSLGILADIQGNSSAALAYYTKALRILPDSPVVLNNYGVSLLKAEKYQLAEQALRKGLGIAPENERLSNNLGMALAWQRQYPEALTVISANLPKASAYNNVGYIAMQQGALEIARRYYNKALELSPTYHVQAAKNLERLESLR